jgi:Lsr2
LRRPARSRRTASGAERRRAGTSTGGLDSTEVRDWVRSQGIGVKDRGRIPVELVVKFKAVSAT